MYTLKHIPSIGFVIYIIVRQLKKIKIKPLFLSYKIVSTKEMSVKKNFLVSSKYFALNV